MLVQLSRHVVALKKCVNDIMPKAFVTTFRQGQQPPRTCWSTSVSRDAACTQVGLFSSSLMIILSPLQVPRINSREQIGGNKPTVFSNKKSQTAQGTLLSEQMFHSAA